MQGKFWSGYAGGVITGAVAFAFLARASAGAPADAGPQAAAGAQQVLSASRHGRATGIGGVFFKAKDPKALQAWYVEHLGFPKAAFGAKFEWREKEDSAKPASTAWAAFKETTTYFDPSAARFMIDYRVDDLDAVREHLKSIGAKVDEKVDTEPNGRFSWAIDPEGNRFELWEPSGG